MACCATSDCGRPTCDVCRWGRTPPVGRHATIDEPIRVDARAEIAPAPAHAPVAKDLYGRLQVAPKARHRIGPHR